MSRPKILDLKKTGEFNDWLEGDQEGVEGIDYDTEEEYIREEEE